MRRADPHLNEDGTEKRRMTRAEAIGAVRRFPESERMSIYRCGDHWHVGHSRAPLERREVMVRREVSPDPFAEREREQALRALAWQQSLIQRFRAWADAA